MDKNYYQLKRHGEVIHVGKLIWSLHQSRIPIQRTHLHEQLMTYGTIVLMKKTLSMKRINSPIEMFEHKDIKYLVVKDGVTGNFFKYSDKQFYMNTYTPKWTIHGFLRTQTACRRYKTATASTCLWSTRVEQYTGWTRNPATSSRSDLAQCWTATSIYAFATKKDSRQNYTTTTSGRDCREPYMTWRAMASWSVWRRSGGLTSVQLLQQHSASLSWMFCQLS